MKAMWDIQHIGGAGANSIPTKESKGSELNLRTSCRFIRGNCRPCSREGGDSLGFEALGDGHKTSNWAEAR